MSPEQATGHPLDARSDQFAWGIVLYELLFNQKLFAAENDIKILNQIRRCEINFHPDASKKLLPGLENILRKVFSKNPEQRYAHAHELSRELETILPEGRRLNAEELAAYFAELMGTESSVMEGDKKPLTLSRNLNEENILLSNARYGRLTSSKNQKPKKTRSRFLNYGLSALALIAVSAGLFWAGSKFSGGPPPPIELGKKIEPIPSQQEQWFQGLQDLKDWPQRILTASIGPFASLQTLKKHAPLKTEITVSPAQATLFLKYPGGEQRAEGKVKTPLLPPGSKVTASATLKGYDSKYLEISLDPASIQPSYQLSLKKTELRYGSIQVNARPWGKVYMGGFIGGQATPVGRGKIPVGSYSVTVKSPDGSKSASARVKINPDSTARCMASFGDKASLSCH
jgi:hypothetical protein